MKICFHLPQNDATQNPRQWVFIQGGSTSTFPNKNGTDNALKRSVDWCAHG